jgi:C1A family cysteine protease
MSKILFSFLLISQILLISSKKIGCIIWKNNYITLQNVTETPDNSLIQIDVYSKHLTGWFGVSFSKNETLDASSVMIYASYPNTAHQIFNHTLQKSNESSVVGIILNLGIQSYLEDKKSFTAFLNVSYFKDMKYFTFAFGEKSFVNHATFMVPYDLLKKSQNFEEGSVVHF